MVATLSWGFLYAPCDLNLELIKIYFFPVSVGGVAKSQNSSQMNLSGSSSSLTSDASTKAGTASLRSYGIGGALLHKRILLMTSQHSRENSRERENPREEEEKEERSEEEKEKTEADQTGFFSSEQKRRRGRQLNKPDSQTNAGLTLFRVRAGSQMQKCSDVNPEVHTSPPPILPGQGALALSPTSQPQYRRPKPQESPIKTRMMSPFRKLRERSQSRERLMAFKEERGEILPSSVQDETQRQSEQRAKRSASPNPFKWLCREKRARRETVWH